METDSEIPNGGEAGGKTMQAKFEEGLRELINLCLEGDKMQPSEMTEALERELKWSREPWAERQTVR